MAVDGTIADFVDFVGDCALVCPDAKLAELLRSLRDLLVNGGLGPSGESVETLSNMAAIALTAPPTGRELDLCETGRLIIFGAYLAGEPVLPLAGDQFGLFGLGCGDCSKMSFLSGERVGGFF